MWPRRHAFALVLALVLAAVISSMARGARASDAVECRDHHRRGQSLRRDGSLTLARTEFASCGAKNCPDVLRADCIRWLTEVEAELPSVILVARDDHGNDLSDVQVSIDGAPPERLGGGTAIVLDPGGHTVRYGRPGGEVVERRIVLHQAEKNRSVEATFPSRVAPTVVHDDPRASAAPEPPRSKPGRTAAFVVGGLGVVALGTFSFFAIRGQNDFDDLRSRCAPDCTAADRDAVHTAFLAADVSLGAAAVLLGLGVYLYLTASPTRGASNAR